MKNKIAALRREKGLTQQEVADFLGISKPAIAQYESGKTESIRPHRLIKLAELFNASPAYIMGWSELRCEPSPEEIRLLDACRSLNQRGRAQVQLRLWELSQISYYTSDIINTEEEAYLRPIAAHADEAAPEVIKSEVERISKLIEKNRR